jgi:lipopolysaccharide export system permease protein
MLKIYQKYLLIGFIKKFLNISIIFFVLINILGILEEINFTKDLGVNFLYPIFLTLLNSPITLFEIFPFIFLLTTQFLLYDLFNKDELRLFKLNGLTNLGIVKNLFLISIFMGIFNISIYYNLASNLKFFYSNIKNDLSTDNKYLAMVNNSGFWIKDEVNNKILIIKSNKIEKNILSKTVINEFDNNFNLLRNIQSEKIDISENNWVIYNPIITVENKKLKTLNKTILSTNFNEDKINNLFSDVTTYNIIKLLNLKKDFDKLGYSSIEIIIHLLTLLSLPIFYGVITTFSANIMFNYTKNKNFIFQIIFGVMLSVLIYYVTFIFKSLGNNGSIPIFLSIFFPLIIIYILSSLGLVNLNEK